MMKKILIILFSLTLIITLLIFLFVATAPSLPEETGRIITEVMESEPADEIPGETGYADSSGIRIWYKSVSPAGVPKGDILLISGIASDSMWWPSPFVRSLTEAGYRVILFDNRSSGMSDWRSDHPHWRYTFADMANDGAAVLDKLKVKEAHVIGVSMGGMIAQQMAITNASKVRTLTSVMSSANLDDPELPRVPWKTVVDVVRISCRYGIIRTERNIVKLHLGIWQLFRNETLTEDDIRSITKRVFFNIRKRRGYNTLSFPQQLNAIIVSGSRYEGLTKITKPSLFIHGERDPLIPYPHGVRCSKLVKGSSLMLIKKMGHDISSPYSERIAERITGFISTDKLHRPIP